MTEPQNVHATGLVYDGVGLILRGPSGAGKSLLALALLDDAALRGLKARLVGDDRLLLVADAGRLLMRPAPNLAGLIELRGRGIVRRPYLAEAGVDLVVDLLDRLDRMPEPVEFTVAVLGVERARCPLPPEGTAGLAHRLLLLREAVAALKEQTP